MRWLLVDTPRVRKFPRWQRYVAVDDDGTVYASAAMTGDETAAFLSAAADGVSSVEDHGHIYLPTHWLARAFPQLAAVCRHLERQVRDSI